MVQADAAGNDVGFEVVLAQDGRASQTAQHGNLADVIERIGDRALEEALSGAVERLGRRQVVVELLDDSEKPFDFGVPLERCGVVPSLFALRDGQSPVKQVTHVGENLRWRAGLVADMERVKAVRRAAQGFPRAIGNGGESVAQKLAGGIERCGRG